MSSGDHGDPVTGDTGRDLANEPDDVAARTAAAVRAFAALSLSDTSDDRAAAPPLAADDQAPPAAPAPGTSVGAEPPLRPDAVLRGRRFTAGRTAAPDAETDCPPVEQLRLTEDRRRAERRRLTDERREADRTGASDTSSPDDDVPARAAPPSLPPAGGRDRALLHLLALTVAAGALVAPVVWPVAVALGALAGVTARSVAVHGPAPGPLVTRAARRAVGWLRPGSLVWLPVLVARTVLIAVLVSATLWALEWVLTEGSDGVLVAARTGVWADGFRAAGAVLCFMLVTGVGDARHRRAALLRRAVSSPVTAAPLAGVAACVLAAALLIVPRVDAGPVTRLDGLQWVPPAARGAVDRVRDRIVLTEVQSAAECLESRQDIVWQGGYTTRNALDADDVVTLTTRSGQPTPSQLATAAVTLHDVLAPWVDTIVIEAGGGPVVEIERGHVRDTRPVASAAPLVPAATAGATTLDTGRAGFDAEVARRCASGITL